MFSYNHIKTENLYVNYKKCFGYFTQPSQATLCQQCNSLSQRNSWKRAWKNHGNSWMTSTKTQVSTGRKKPSRVRVSGGHSSRLDYQPLFGKWAPEEIVAVSPVCPNCQWPICQSNLYLKLWKVWTQELFQKYRLSLIVRVNVVLNRTVAVDSDWRFDNLCGSHL